MIKKISLIMLCLYLSVAYFIPDVAYASDEAVYECKQQLLQKFPNVEAIKKQFGNEAKWQARTVPSPHDPDLELRIDSMEYPGIRISTLGYTHGGEDSFFITSADVNKAGSVDFLGIDIGSAREVVIKTFGPPQKIDGNELIYYDESEYMVIKFIFEKGIVAGMRFDNYLD